jgi:hypothetical protein
MQWNVFAQSRRLATNGQEPKRKCSTSLTFQVPAKVGHCYALRILNLTTSPSEVFVGHVTELQLANWLEVSIQVGRIPGIHLCAEP